MAGGARVTVEGIDALQASAKELFISDLRHLRERSGRPSLSIIAGLSRGKFSRNTIDDHLSGRRTGIPNWRITSAYIHACYDFASSTGLSIESLGSIEEWRDRWESAQSGDKATASPVREIDSMVTMVAANVENHSDTTAGIAAVRDGFEIDIQKLRKTLPRNAGVLILTNSSDIGMCFDVRRDLVTIGRSPESDIILADSTVSRRHAVIYRRVADFTVKDIGSRNGTYLHQKKIIEESQLPSGEELQIGIFRMLFIQGTG